MSSSAVKKKLRRLAASAVLLTWGSVSLSAVPQDTTNQEAQRERARQLLAESLRGSDPILLQARAKAARRLFAEAGDPLGEGLSLLTIASVEILEGDFAAGKATFDRAAEVVSASGDTFSAAFVRMAEAAGWRAVGRHEEAIVCLRKSMAMLEEASDQDAELSLEFIRYFAPQQFPAEALEQVDPLLHLLKPVLVQSFQAMALVEMAGIQREQGLYEEALKTLDRALALQNPLLGGIAILVEKAEVELALGRSARSLELYESALPLARRRGDLALQVRILRGLADVHEKEGRDQEAARHRERAAALMPSGR